jgi:hypothetical protein
MKKRTVLIIVCIVGLFSCGTSRLERAALYIEPGMTQNQVLSVMGTPGNRQFEGSNEAWQWCRTGWEMTGDSYIVVWFYRGYVTGMNSYKNFQYGSCSAFYRTINWEERPNDIIEFRHR